MNGAALFSTLLAQVEQNVALQSFEFAQWFGKQESYITIPSILVVVFLIPFLLGWLLANNLRMQSHGWKIGLIFSALTASVVAVFLGWPPKLGVDLKFNSIEVHLAMIENSS